MILLNKQKGKYMIKKIILILILTSNIYSALPSYVYERAKNHAQEKLIIKVQELSINDVKNTRYITITAKILNVKKTHTNLKKDSIIKIKYNRILQRELGWVGPAENFELKKNKKYIAYLRKSNKQYFIPDALGNSFNDYKKTIIYTKEKKIELQ